MPSSYSAARRHSLLLFGYNDSSAIGAMRAMHEAHLRVPEDVSVVGFDDIQSAAYSYPSLTTVRQPLQKMGEIAARTLLGRIENREPYVTEIAIEPEFVVRNSTAQAPTQSMTTQAIMEPLFFQRNKRMTI